MTTSFTRGGRTEEPNCLPVSTVFEVLSDERRRHVLYYLIDEAGGRSGVSAIADHVRSVESGGGGIDDEDDGIPIELHHRHLPMMESADLIEYDDQAESVRYLEDPLVEECLARVVARDFGEQS